MKEFETIIALINAYTAITRDILLQFDNINLPRLNPTNVRLLFIKRFHYNSLAILRLIDDYKNDQSFKLPLFIILRSCISDFLSLKYIDKIIKDNKESQDLIEQTIKGYLVDNIKFLKREIDYLLQDGELSIDKADADWKNIQTLYSEFFDTDTGELISSEYKQPSQIKRFLKDDERYLLDSKAYDLYNLFSKFEHLGALSFDLQKDREEYTDFEQKSIIMAISWIFFGLELLIVNLPENNNYVEKWKNLEPILKKLIGKK